MKQLDLYIDETGRQVSCSVVQTGQGEPHIVLLAMQHGNEVVGLDAALRVFDTLSTEKTSRITLLTCLNPEGFHNQTREAFMMPTANLSNVGCNLNRVHPGNRQGTLPERLAANVDDYIQSLKPDVVIDLHSYANQSVPHVILDPALPEIMQRMKDIAVTSGLPWYWDFADGDYSAQGLNKSLSAIWCNRDTPAFTLELGPMGGFSQQQGEAAAEALRALLAAIGACQSAGLEDENTRAMAQLLKGREWQRVEITSNSDYSGYVRQLAPIGVHVSKDEVVAAVVVLNGTDKGDIVAPDDGVIFIWHEDPRVLPGSVVGVLLKEKVATRAG